MFLNKKILLFSASFFGYQNEIKNRLETLGATVDLFDERPKNTFLYKLIIRKRKNILRKSIYNYYLNIFTDVKYNNYDFVFFLKAEVIDVKSLHLFKDNFKNAKFILYMWDSIKHYSYITKLFPLFDQIFSFDKEDAEKIKEINFRPLFYTNEYSKIKKVDSKFKYDTLFIGTAHLDRYPVLLKIKNNCIKNNINHLFFSYLQDPKVYLIFKLISKSFRQTPKSYFKFKSISKIEIIKLVEQSKCIIDIEKTEQTGLTMRTIETLGAKRKLITTNSRIEGYEFFNENNILVIDRENPEIPKEFLKSNYIDLESNIYQKYSLDKWLEEVLLTNKLI